MGIAAAVAIGAAFLYWYTSSPIEDTVETTEESEETKQDYRIYLEESKMNTVKKLPDGTLDPMGIIHFINFVSKTVKKMRSKEV